MSSLRSSSGLAILRACVVLLAAIGAASVPAQVLIPLPDPMPQPVPFPLPLQKPTRYFPCWGWGPPRLDVSADASTVVTGTSINLSAQFHGFQTRGYACDGSVSWATSGGTVTPTSVTAATFSAGPGIYTITATSTAVPSVTGSVAVTVTCGAPDPNAMTKTYIGSITTSDSWTGNGMRHHVSGSYLNITGTGVVVTVEACAVVEIDSGTSISVANGAQLISAGTDAVSRVFFRRAAAGSAWGSLEVDAASKIDLSWTNLEGGGSAGQHPAAIAATGSGTNSLPTPNLKVSNVLIDHSTGSGVYLDADAAFTADSTNLQITGAGSNPILAASLMSIGSIPTGTYTGNSIDEFLASGTSTHVIADTTLHNRGVPLRLAYGGGDVQVNAPQPVPNVKPPAVTLTIEPGAVLKFSRSGGATGGGLAFGGSGKAALNNDPVGILNAQGTAQQPIIFTSAEATPTAGDWAGILLLTANGSKLDHVEIDFAGSTHSSKSNNCRPTVPLTTDSSALMIGNGTEYQPPADLITNSKIQDTAGHGVDAIWNSGSADAATPNLLAPANGNVVAGYTSGWCAQTYNAVTGASCPKPNGADVVGCTSP